MSIAEWVGICFQIIGLITVVPMFCLVLFVLFAFVTDFIRGVYDGVKKKWNNRNKKG